MCIYFYLNAGYLETAPFDTNAFANEMITSSHFQITTQQPLAVLSDPTFQELYRDIALVQKYEETNKKVKFLQSHATIPLCKRRRLCVLLCTDYFQHLVWVAPIRLLY